MENHLYSTLQSPYSPVASLGMPWSKTQFHNNEIDGYQDIHLLPATIMPFNYTIPAGGALFSSPATPIASDLGSPTVIDFRAMHSNNGHMSKAQAVKRRMQNREAQRRLRERKEEQQKILEENTAKLEARIAELSAGLSEKSEEESRILKEKDALAKEVRGLRERWHLIERLMQRADWQESLSTLISGCVTTPDAVEP